MAFGFFNDVIKYFNGSWARENELIDHYKSMSDKKAQEIIDNYDYGDGDLSLSEDLDCLCDLVSTTSAICGARLGMKRVLKEIDKNDIES